MKTRPDDELKNILTELVDKHFPKHECQERGQAMVLAAEALRAFAAHTEAACREAETNAVAWCIGKIDTLHNAAILQEDYDKAPIEYDREYKGLKNIIRDTYKTETGVDPAPSYPVDAHLTSEKTKWVQGGLDKSSEQIDIEIDE